MKKKEYIVPQSITVTIETGKMMAESMFDPIKDFQDITLTEDEHKGKFNTKGYKTTSFDWDQNW